MKILKLGIDSLFGTDGSGNQKKAWVEHKYLIKLNSKLKEASKEVDACRLAEIVGLNHANYKEIKVLVDNVEHKACITETYLKPYDVEISTYEILTRCNIDFTYKMSAIEILNKTISAIESYTGLSYESVTFYIYSMLIFDFLICNDDRHLTNFGVIFNEQTQQYRFTPLYDHGESFFRTDAVLTKKEYDTKCHKFKSKPFSTNPVKNLGDFGICKQVFLSIDREDLKQEILDSDIREGHKYTIIRQYNRLHDLLHV